MNKKTKNILLGIMASIVIISGLTACNDNEKTNNNSNNNFSVNSGEEEKIIDNNTYNNGGLFVQYKGKTYYREYSNSDIEEGGVWANYSYRTDAKTSKYINAISSNGKIENVFEDDGYGEFYILDDRFYFTGYNKLYSVNMKGEEHRDFGKGTFVGCDEENHKIYYENMNNNALYSIDTQSLRITKLGDYDVSLIEDGILYFEDSISDETGKIKLSRLDSQSNKVEEICAITFTTQNEYYISDMKKYGENLFISVGYDSGTLNTYSDSKLYAVNIEDNSYKLLDISVERELKLQDDVLYYNFVENTEDGKTTLKKVDLKTMQVSSVTEVQEPVVIENDNLIKNSETLIYLDENLNKKEIVSSANLASFKENYNISVDDENYLLQVTNVELVGNKIYYAIELSKANEDYTIGWRPGYERVATEVYMYDLNSARNTMLYLYKATDKDEIASGDIYGSGESNNIEEPLAENEMYLEIKLADKGLKETFDIRVEEVGGLIIGKRIEYEGTHSRTEGTLKIKVTKEIGAMLTVYIDGKLDSQMLIEE